MSNRAAFSRSGLWQRWFKSLNNLQNQLFFHRVASLAAHAERPIALAPINRATRACYQTLRQELPEINEKVHLFDEDPGRFPYYPGRPYTDLAEGRYAIAVIFCDQHGEEAHHAFRQMPGVKFVFGPETFIPLSWIGSRDHRYGLRHWIRDVGCDFGRAPASTLTSVVKATVLNAGYHVANGLMRLLQPVVQVKVWRFRCDRIGHFAANTDLHLATLAAQGNRRTIHRYYYPVGEPVANHALKAMWERRLPVLKFGALAVALNEERADQERFFGTLETDRDPYGLLQRSGPFLHLSKDEQARGQQLLRQLGIPQGARFFVFHARDAGYLKKAHPNTDYSYHNFRDVDIQNFEAAVTMLIRRGYYAVRIGAVVERTMTLEHPHFVDYTQSPHRGPFGDIFLCATCSFMLATSSGIDSVARLFRRPLACTNVVPLGSMRQKPLGLFIPKRLYSRSKQRWLTYDEIVNGPATQFFRAEEYEAAGLECHENTPAEIVAVAEELAQVAEGTWQPTDEDEQLQEQFWQVFQTPAENKNFCRIGAAFLRDNPALLHLPVPENADHET